MLHSETILQSISDALFTLDREWRFTYLNASAEKILLKPAEAVLGKVIWEEFPRIAGTSFEANFRMAAEQNRRVVFEEYFPPFQTWFENTAYPNPDGLLVYFRDINKRKETEQALQAQLGLANLIAEVSQALIQGDNLQAMLQHCTEALVKHLKVAFARIWTFNQPENMLELQASSGEYTHLDGPHGRVSLGSFKIGWIAQERHPHLTNTVIGDELVSNQEWARRENMVAFAGYPLLLEDRLIGVLALFAHEPISDATYQALETLTKQVALGIERKLTEISLREQRENYAVTLTSISDAVIATDNQGRVTYLNTVAEVLTAWRTAEALGQPLTTIFNIVNMTSRLPVENPVSKVLQLGMVVGLANHTILLARDGREIPIDDSAAPIKNTSNEIVGVVLVFRDATERLAGEAERHQLLLREQSARREAEESRNRLHNLFMQAPASIAVLAGPDHVFTFTNPNYLQLIGRSDSIVGLPVREAVPEVEGQGFFELLDNVYQTGKPFYGNEISIKLDRLENGELEEIFLNFVYQPYRNLTGQIEGILVHAVEVSEQVQAQRETEAARTRQHNLFMRAPANIAVLAGPDHVFTFANAPYLSLVGRGNEIIGLPVRQAQPEVEGQGFFEPLDEVYRTGQTFKGYETLVKLDRLGDGNLTEIFLDFVYQPYNNQAGEVEGILFHGVDVTERVQARQRMERLLNQLAEQQGQLKTKNENLKFLSEATVILASSLDYNVTLRQIAGLLVPALADFCYFDIINSAGVVERVAWESVDPNRNDLFEGIATYAPSLEKANHPVSEVLASGKPKLVADVTEQWLQEITRSLEHFELPRQATIISYLAVPLGLRGNIFGVISLCYTSASGRHYSEADQELALELTQRASITIDNAQLYYAAQKALKERETFLSVAAHELKTPLTGLKGFTQVLNRQLERDASQALDPVRVKRTLDIINKQSDKLTYLIDQLLDVSRITSGKLQLDLRETEIVGLVKEVVEQAQSRTTRHTLNFNSPEENLVARLDPVRYEQVVSNLVDNAIKYSPEGGTITLNLSRSEGESARFNFSITDQGLGIPVERRSHIFERFYQAHETTLISGMGLGLYICREIIQLHGGEIRAEFPDQGGTRIIVTVPVAG